MEDIEKKLDRVKEILSKDKCILFAFGTETGSKRLSGCSFINNISEIEARGLVEMMRERVINCVKENDGEMPKKAEVKGFLKDMFHDLEKQVDKEMED